MPERVPVLEMVEAYDGYVSLLSATGHEVALQALAQHLAGDDDRSGELERALRERGDANEIDGAAVARMRGLLTDLLGELYGALGEGVPSELRALVRALADCPEEQREQAADAVLLNGHRKFLRARHTTLAEVQKTLAGRADKGKLALVKVVPHVQRELARRGLEVTEQEVQQWFCDAEPDRQVPYCLKRIVAALGPEFRTGLVGLEEMVGDQDPDEWLEAARAKLQFRSHSAMHKAIAEATSLKYDCVHKALSGRKKAKRIQAEIMYCLQRWLREAEQGAESAIPEDYRGVRVQKMHQLMARLESRYRTKEDIYRLISERTGIKTGSVRRYFQSNGQLKYAPLAVYRCAQQLAVEDQPAERRSSYLADARTRRVAQDLARRANEALVRWHRAGERAEMELAYKELRRALIVTLKEHRCRAPVLACVG